MSEASKLYNLWESGEINLVKVLLENVDYWQTDILLMRISLTNTSDLIEMCMLKGYFEVFYYFETYIIIKKIRDVKFKKLSFTDKVRAKAVIWWFKFRRVHKMYDLPKEMI